MRGHSEVTVGSEATVGPVGWAIPAETAEMEGLEGTVVMRWPQLATMLRSK
jgi:hypothetical protein